VPARNSHYKTSDDNELRTAYCRNSCFVREIHLTHDELVLTVEVCPDRVACHSKLLQYPDRH
jgi:hypothetical protein